MRYLLILLSLLIGFVSFEYNAVSDTDHILSAAVTYAQGGDNDISNKIDPRTMDEIWFPAWKPDGADNGAGPDGEVGTDDDVRPGGCDPASTDRSGLVTGSNYVCGVIGANFDANMVMNFFNRFADLLIKFVAPLLLFFIIRGGILLIISSEGQKASVRASFINAIIGLAIVIFAYSAVKAVFFILTQ